MVQYVVLYVTMFISFDSGMVCPSIILCTNFAYIILCLCQSYLSIIYKVCQLYSMSI